MYESYFGLSARPFQLNPDHRFYFWSKSHRAASAFLKSSMSRGQGVVVVTGEVGAGKTTLVNAQLVQLDPRLVSVAQLVSTQLDVKSLLHAIAIAYGLPLQSAVKAQILLAIETFLLDFLPSGRHALLVVDEAQNLTPEALNAIFLLSTYPMGHRPVLQFLLLGQPELRDRIQENLARSAKQEPIASFHLGPMEEHETRAYIEHRLAHVGWKHDPHFTPKAFAGIHSATDGIPRRVNGICNRLLLAAYLGQRHEIGIKEVDEIVIELRNEIGEDVLPARVDDAGEAAMSLSDRRHADRIRAQMVSAITARLDRLERNVGTMLQMVQALPVDAGRKAMVVPKAAASRAGS
jgi:general secretion pathway protein A